MILKQKLVGPRHSLTMEKSGFETKRSSKEGIFYLGFTYAKLILKIDIGQGFTVLGI
jgi:hypothetical protein